MLKAYILVHENHSRISFRRKDQHKLLTSRPSSIFEHDVHLGNPFIIDIHVFATSYPGDIRRARARGFEGCARVYRREA